MAQRIPRHPEAFALTGGPKRPRVTDDAHLRFIRLLPCLRCGRGGPCEAAHVRYGSLIHGKRGTGAGEKPSDRWTVPLCGEHHNRGPKAQHTRGERLWWEDYGVDPLVIAALLYAASGDEEAGRNIIRNAGCFPLQGE